MQKSFKVIGATVKYEIAHAQAVVGCEKLQYRKTEVLSTLKLPALIFKVLQKKTWKSSKLVAV